MRGLRAGGKPVPTFRDHELGRGPLIGWEFHQRLEPVAAHVAGPQVTDVAIVEIFRPFGGVDALETLRAFDGRPRTGIASAQGAQLHGVVLAVVSSPSTGSDDDSGKFKSEAAGLTCLSRYRHNRAKLQFTLMPASLTTLV
jgi:hypothetical protein